MTIIKKKTLSKKIFSFEQENVEKFLSLKKFFVDIY